MAIEDSAAAIARLTTEVEALRATGILDDDVRIRDRLTAIEAHNSRMRESVELQEKRNRLLQIELDLLALKIPRTAIACLSKAPLADLNFFA